MAAGVWRHLVVKSSRQATMGNGPGLVKRAGPDPRCGASSACGSFAMVSAAWRGLARPAVGLRCSRRVRRDIVATLLAIAASLALYWRAPLAIALVWVFNVWGASDFLFAYYQGLVTVQLDARMFGAAYFIPTVFVPAGLITHGLIFWLLVRRGVSR